MTCIVNAAKYPSKRILKETIEGINMKHIWSSVEKGEVFIEDPSIVSPRSFYASDLREGENVVVTNHPKRSYFAKIERKNGKLKVS